MLATPAPTAAALTAGLESNILLLCLLICVVGMLAIGGILYFGMRLFDRFPFTANAEQIEKVTG